MGLIFLHPSPECKISTLRWIVIAQLTLCLSTRISIFFSEQFQRINILDFVGHNVSVATTQLMLKSESSY